MVLAGLLLNGARLVSATQGKCITISRCFVAPSSPGRFPQLAVLPIQLMMHRRAQGEETLVEKVASQNQADREDHARCGGLQAARQRTTTAVSSGVTRLEKPFLAISLDRF
jgi:hypothetical protein